MGVSPGYYGMGMKPLTIGVFGLAGNEKITDNPQVNVWGYGQYLSPRTWALPVAMGEGTSIITAPVPSTAPSRSTTIPITATSHTT